MKTTRRSWTVGSRCLAPFYEDNLWYPAEIRQINEERNECEVLYDGYGNTDWVDTNDLARIDDASEMNSDTSAAESVSHREENVLVNGGECSKSAKHPNAEIFKRASRMLPSIAPPAPPAFLNQMNRMGDDPENTETNMLISWYMCGYHTGYHQALKDMAQGSSKK
ncbi:unnamed protein product [Anisakis simplex]|uniref:Tudor domain-containing protein n=1 Tax=Anisakis simplex TaxID=6269 RepID=A0A0M3KCS1_ANISI|nr:unnamed protein product [Anisakis simplex]